MTKLLLLPALLLILLSLAGCFTTHGGPYYHRDNDARYEECRRENPDNPDRCRDSYPRDGRHMRGY